MLLGQSEDGFRMSLAQCLSSACEKPQRVAMMNICGLYRHRIRVTRTCTGHLFCPPVERMNTGRFVFPLVYLRLPFHVKKEEKKTDNGVHECQRQIRSDIYEKYKNRITIHLREISDNDLFAKKNPVTARLSTYTHFVTSRKQRISYTLWKTRSLLSCRTRRQTITKSNRRIWGNYQAININQSSKQWAQGQGTWRFACLLSLCTSHSSDLVIFQASPFTRSILLLIDHLRFWQKNTHSRSFECKASTLLSQDWRQQIQGLAYRE